MITVVGRKTSTTLQALHIHLLEKYLLGVKLAVKYMSSP